MIVRERKRDKERETIQIHRICSRSQTICVCKEEGTKKKKETGKKEKKSKEGRTRRDEHNGEGNRNPSKREGNRGVRKGKDK